MSSQKGYGQYCPVARAAEVIAERWTPLVIRELLLGSVRFNDLQRGLPRMSPVLLSRRLKELEHAGVVERRPSSSGRGNEYHLTEAGRELYPIVEGMGAWAQRWLRTDLTQSRNLDPDLLMWDVRRNVTRERIPQDRRYVVLFQFSGVPASRRRYWLVFDVDGIDLCAKDPGHEIDLYVSCHIRTMTEIWLGHVDRAVALRDERLRLDGAPADIHAFSAWFTSSALALQPPA